MREDEEPVAQFTWWQRLRVRNAERKNIARLEYISGFRPAVQHGHLVWKVPPAPVDANGKPCEFESRFKIWHDNGQWRIDGEMFLVSGDKHAPAGAGPGVRHRRGGVPAPGRG